MLGSRGPPLAPGQANSPNHVQEGPRSYARHRPRRKQIRFGRGEFWVRGTGHRIRRSRTAIATASRRRSSRCGRTAAQYTSPWSTRGSTGFDGCTRPGAFEPLASECGRTVRARRGNRCRRLRPAAAQPRRSAATMAYLPVCETWIARRTRVSPIATAFSLRSRRLQVRILPGAPTLQALFPKEKGLFCWVFAHAGRRRPVSGSGPKRSENRTKGPFEHQKLPEKLPDWRPSLGRRAGTSRGSCARASGASESASTTARCTPSRLLAATLR